MDIGGAISAVTAAIGFARELNSVDVQVDQATLKLKIAELTGALADAKIGLVDVESALRQRDAEISRLNDMLALRTAKLVDKGQFRYFANDGGEASGNPLCPICEKTGDFHPLAQDRSRGAGGVSYFCPKCKSNYGAHVTRFGR